MLAETRIFFSWSNITHFFVLFFLFIVEYVQKFGIIYQILFFCPKINKKNVKINAPQNCIKQVISAA
jgi:hypothetical protein